MFSLPSFPPGCSMEQMKLEQWQKELRHREHIRRLADQHEDAHDSTPPRTAADIQRGEHDDRLSRIQQTRFSAACLTKALQQPGRVREAAEHDLPQHDPELEAAVRMMEQKRDEANAELQRLMAEAAASNMPVDDMREGRDLPPDKAREERMHAFGRVNSDAQRLLHEFAPPLSQKLRTAPTLLRAGSLDSGSRTHVSGTSGGGSMHRSGTSGSDDSSSSSSDSADEDQDSEEEEARALLAQAAEEVHEARADLVVRPAMIHSAMATCSVRHSETDRHVCVAEVSLARAGACARTHTHTHTHFLSRFLSRASARSLSLCVCVCVFRTRM